MTLSFSLVGSSQTIASSAVNRCMSLHRYRLTVQFFTTFNCKIFHTWRFYVGYHVTCMGPSPQWILEIKSTQRTSAGPSCKPFTGGPAEPKEVWQVPLGLGVFSSGPSSFNGNKKSLIDEHMTHCDLMTDFDSLCPKNKRCPYDQFYGLL